MLRPEASPASSACAIPPEVFDVAFAWDPRPEIQRLLFLCGSCGLAPRSALELGCGTGRLLGPLAEQGVNVVGLELSPAMAEFARRRTGSLRSSAVEVLSGDMRDFALGHSFDLIYTSANTIRHVLLPASIERMWKCIADHLGPGGIFVADLELGVAAEAAKVGQPATWYMARDDTLVHVTWIVKTPPDPATRCCEIEWTFEAQGDELKGRWSQSFHLRTYDGDEFVALATSGGRLRPRGIYEIRSGDPPLVPNDRAIGRAMVVLQADAGRLGRDAWGREGSHEKG